MKLELKDKVALVTGASKGLAKAIALALAAEGCRVAITARSKDDLEQVADEIRAASGTAFVVAADATKAEDNQRLIDETVAQFGTVHILVNNTGSIGSAAPFDQLSDLDWLNLFQPATATTMLADHRIFGSDAWAQLDPAFSYNGLRMSVSRKSPFNSMAESVTDVRMSEKSQFALEMDHMADCVIHNKQPHTPGEEGLQDHKLMATIYQAAQTGRTITLPRVSGLDVTRGPAPRDLK